MKLRLFKFRRDNIEKTSWPRKGGKKQKLPWLSPTRRILVLSLFGGWSSSQAILAPNQAALQEPEVEAGLSERRGYVVLMSPMDLQRKRRNRSFQFQCSKKNQSHKALSWVSFVQNIGRLIAVGNFLKQSLWSRVRCDIKGVDLSWGWFYLVFVVPFKNRQKDTNTRSESFASWGELHLQKDLEMDDLCSSVFGRWMKLKVFTWRSQTPFRFFTQPSNWVVEMVLLSSLAVFLDQDWDGNLKRNDLLANHWIETCCSTLVSQVISGPGSLLTMQVTLRPDARGFHNEAGGCWQRLSNLELLNLCWLSAIPKLPFGEYFCWTFLFQTKRANPSEASKTRSFANVFSTIELHY